MKTSKLFLFLIFVIISFISCENNTESEELVTVEISLEKLSDQLGDKDGTASVEELQFVEKYFQTNNEMWIITNCMNESNETVKADVVKNSFSIQSTPFSSEAKLRNENEGASIRTPFIGITLIEQNSVIEIVRTFRSHGANFASDSWDEIKIIK